MTTEYQKIKAQLQKKAGRPRLSADEKQRRKEAQKQEVRRRTEARRRAHLVLQYKYKDEFETLFNEEYNQLVTDKRFSTESK